MTKKRRGGRWKIQKNRARERESQKSEGRKEGRKDGGQRGKRDEKEEREMKKDKDKNSLLLSVRVGVRMDVDVVVRPPTGAGATEYSQNNTGQHFGYGQKVLGGEHFEIPQALSSLHHPLS